MCSILGFALFAAKEHGLAHTFNQIVSLVASQALVPVWADDLLDWH